jgi:hypothetical protein
VGTRRPRTLDGHSRRRRLCDRRLGCTGPPAAIDRLHQPPRRRAIILPFTILLAPVGARLAHALQPIWVKRAFGLFLAITAIEMLHATLT